MLPSLGFVLPSKSSPVYLQLIGFPLAWIPADNYSCPSVTALTPH